MSRLVDEQRKEEALSARVEVAKQTLRQLQRVVQAEVDGLSLAETARLLNESRETITLWRCYLRLHPSLAPLHGRLRRAASRKV